MSRQMTLAEARTFGPAFDPELDGKRIKTQHEVIKRFMLTTGRWWTLAEINERLHYPTTSISAQLRHLKKPQFGGYILKKRRRSKGAWEYKVERRT